MATCPNGHDSVSTDFCDVCGMRIDVPPGAPTSGAPASGVPAEGVSANGAPTGEATPGAASAPPAPAEPCPQCGANRTGQFCESCGFDFTAGPAPASPPPVPDPASPAPQPDPLGPPVTSGSAGSPGAAWTAVVTADRAYFDSVVAAGGQDAGAIEFPVYCPERRFPLTGREMRIGRRSASRGLEPEIDLTGPPTDPGISRLHAVLTAEASGNWAVLDPGSANGTQVNGRDIPAGVAVPLNDGDRICIGGWTVLTIHAG